LLLFQHKVVSIATHFNCGAEVVKIQGLVRAKAELSRHILTLGPFYIGLCFILKLTKVDSRLWPRCLDLFSFLSLCASVARLVIRSHGTKEAGRFAFKPHAFRNLHFA
jgi:hypothetical protein